MMGSFITRGVIMALGYVYPAYECYKIVETKDPDVEHLRFWCQYWMIIAVVTVLERLGDVLISWVPMYSEAKLAFIIYLWYPKTMGTTYIYHSLLRPFVAKHESEIDQNLDELRTRAGDVALLWWQRGSVYVQARFFELLQFVASQSDRTRQVSVSTQGPPGALPRPTPQAPPRGRPQRRAAGAGVQPGLYPPQGDQGGKGAHFRRQSGSRGFSDGEGEADYNEDPVERLGGDEIQGGKGAHLRRQSGSRGFSDGEGEADCFKGPVGRSGGEEIVPPRVHNTRRARS